MNLFDTKNLKMGQILSLTGEIIKFRINEGGNWIFTRNHSEYMILEKQDCYHILPLIELDRNILLENLTLEIGSKDVRLSPKRIYQMLLYYCLESNTHWGNKAIKRIVTKDIDEELESLIEIIIKERRYDQKGRHYLRKLLVNN